MPLVRIDLPLATSQAEAAAVSRTVHQALVEVFKVPEDDLFQVIGRRGPGELICASRYLGIGHTDKVVFVQVTAAPGRTVGMKESLFARIAAGIAQATGFLADDVIINLVESARENWSFGAGIAQYAVQDSARS